MGRGGVPCFGYGRSFLGFFAPRLLFPEIGFWSYLGVLVGGGYSIWVSHESELDMLFFFLPISYSRSLHLVRSSGPVRLGCSLTL